MCQRLFQVVLFCGFLAFVWQGVAAGEREARQFANHMIRQLGLPFAKCPESNVRQAESSRMKLVCARYRGTYDQFRKRWDLQLELGQGPTSRVSVVGDWTEFETTRLRYYRVIDTMAAVAFDTRSRLLVVMFARDAEPD